VLKKILRKTSSKPSNLIIPKHIAIIMDGNARYAKKLAMPTKFGHKKGTENVEKIAEYCIEIGVKYLTIYAFSSENWNRPQDEVNYLMDLLYEYLNKDAQRLTKNGIKIIISGNLEKVNEKLKAKILEVEEFSKDNKNLILNVAFSYGARQELVEATKKIAIAIENKSININDINENLLKNFLYKPEIPDPDLLIRTGGDFRVSNFLLWQIAYTELYFCNKMWPEFGKQDLLKAINNFNQRERRYGKR